MTPRAPAKSMVVVLLLVVPSVPLAGDEEDDVFAMETGAPAPMNAKSSGVATTIGPHGLYAYGSYPDQ